MAVGKRIESIAKEKKISLRKIALSAGISYNTLYAIVKRDSNRIDLETLEKIAAALEVDIADLKFSEPVAKAFKSAINGSGMRVFSELQKQESQKSRLDEAYSKLNRTGQQKAVERVEELAMIPDYQNNDPGEK